MKRIVTLVTPVAFEQDIVVYEDNNKIDFVKTDMDHFYEVMVNLVQQYDIPEIRLLGAKKYANGIKDKLSEEILTKYTKNEVNIIVK